ncbi:MAG: nodulation protein NfeD [Candidatus Eremiobacteraeota bacterium]|nr:nodulation protein NfeD [Candidatus Eremiobacteraeota bacterium]
MPKKYIFIIILLMGLVLLSSSLVIGRNLPDKDQPVDVIVVKGAIFSSTARYIERGIKQSEEDGAICIIQLDTPGGLVKSMRDIIQAMQASEVPVVVYVSPHGAMATSAGAYITYASHIAAMAPGTHIGSAHPVSIGQENKRWKKNDENPYEFGKKKEDDKKSKDKKKDDKKIKEDKKKEKSSPGVEADIGMEKATNAMVALIRSLAEKTGRNADWAEKAVRESASITANEAVKLKVVEINAEDLRDLLEKLRGRKVTLPGKKVVTLYPSQDNIKYIRMSAIERFLLTINDPQIAIILMFLGTMGLYFELANPGATIPGIIGGICIILSLYTLGSLPINYAALGLIILAAILFIAEVFTPTFGALTMGGVIAFTLGAVFLIPAGVPYLEISKSLIFSIALLMGIISFLIFTMVIKMMRTKPVSGKEGMIGKIGTAKENLDPEGTILFMGEFWNAKSEGDIIQKGKKVKVEKVEGLLLHVKEYEE